MYTLRDNNLFNTLFCLVEMGDIGSDTSAELHMLMGAYKALKAKDPNHELLRFAQVDRDEGGLTFAPDYGKRFVCDDDIWKVQGYARYTSALESAVRG